MICKSVGLAKEGKILSVYVLSTVGCCIEIERHEMLRWKRDATGWRLFGGKRSFGRVVPDQKWPGMWRVVLHNGRLSDMANLSRARNSVMAMADRELEYEARKQAA